VDNLTHTLVGVIAGEAIARSTAAVPGGLPAETRRAFFVTIAAVGGNMPDLDLILTYGGFAPGKLGYLLHHRGHTHTVLGCVVLALLLYACVEGWARIRHLALTRSDRLSLLGVALFSVMLHLAMDALNSYGVHPYWPFYDGWVYGDSVFIIEPLYWIAAAPLIFTMRTALARGVIAFAVLLALGVSVFVNLAQPAWFAGILLLTVGLLVAGKRGSSRTAAQTSGVVALGVTAVFVSAGFAATHRVESIAARNFPAYRTIDHALTPTPTNPICWDVLLVQTDGGRYTVRHGLLSNAPSLVPAERCRVMRFGESATAPITAVAVASSPEMHWLGEFTMPESRLASLVAGNCEAFELMQFARVPYAVEREGHWIIGDLRFDREAALGLAEIELSNPVPRCQHNVPWTPPRESLLGGALPPRKP
jgi:inner membrane protein